MVFLKESPRIGRQLENFHQWHVFDQSACFRLRQKGEVGWGDPGQVSLLTSNIED